MQRRSRSRASSVDREGAPREPRRWARPRAQGSQYPGVARSIASGVDNVAALLRLPGLLLVVPRVHHDLTTTRVAVMDFIDAEPMAALGAAPQARRNAARALLERLLFRDLFAIIAFCKVK